MATAIILVGGEGTRLRPLTETIPKPLIPLVDRPFLDHVLDHLGAHGVGEVILSSPYLEAVCVAIDILASPEYARLRGKLDANVRRLVAGATALGLAVLGGLVPIVSVLVGPEEATLRAGRYLFEHGFYVQSVIFPAVPHGAGVLRIQVNANHEAAQIVDILCLGPDYHVVWPGDVLSLSDTRELADANSDLSSLADLCLNENVRLHHAVLPGPAPGSGMANATLRACCQARVRSPGVEKSRRPALRADRTCRTPPRGDSHDHLRPRRIRADRSDLGGTSAQ